MGVGNGVEVEDSCIYIERDVYINIILVDIGLVIWVL